MIFDGGRVLVVLVTNTDTTENVVERTDFLDGIVDGVIFIQGFLGVHQVIK